LQSAIADLRRDLESLRDAATAAETDDVLAFEGLKDLDARLRGVESLPERVEKVFRELSRASGDAITHQQGLLHDAVGRLHELEARVEAVESLPADLEGLYAALFRVAESVKALREDPERT
jgi:predicted translin family RNA/ssDNA-binding protein